jgi:hypothetical protein
LRAVNMAAHGPTTIPSTSKKKERQVRAHGTRMAAAGALALFATGCSIDPRLLQGPEPVRLSRMARERQINDDWQNHTLRELVDDWGPPRRMLEIPGGGSPPGFVMVYGRDALTGCIDAFAIMYGEVMRVRSYQCR